MNIWIIHYGWFFMAEPPCNSDLAELRESFARATPVVLRLAEHTNG